MKKIMFNDRYGLTQAVIEGRKTMTRRIVGVRMIMACLKGYTEVANNCAQYNIGDIVAVAQRYNDIAPLPFPIPINHKGRFNKMFVKAELMPHQIKITDIKVERLQDISDEECIKEGVVNIGSLEGSQYVPSMNVADVFECPQDAFASLIDKVSGKGTWERNPWVFEYTFELVK